MSKVLERLAETYPQLYLDPDKESIDSYKATVMKGIKPESTNLDHFDMDARDSIETVDTPAGPVRVITLYNRHDFELFIRCMMAAKEGPERPVPATMGASTLVAFNWPRIHAHRDEWISEQRSQGVLFPDWNAEFKRFTRVKNNYQDMLIVISFGPYSNICADDAGMDEDKWLKASQDIRLYHECTHFICRRLWPELTNAVRDELVADSTGLYAAFGRVDLDLAKMFLGIGDDGTYIGGRLENYIEGIEYEDGRSADAQAVLDRTSFECLQTLKAFASIAEENKGSEVFDMMQKLELSGVGFQAEALVK